MNSTRPVVTVLMIALAACKGIASDTDSGVVVGALDGGDTNDAGCTCVHGACQTTGTCSCEAGYEGASCAQCAVGWHASGALCLPDAVSVAHYPLEIIQPRAGLGMRNRFYKAYPGLEYNVRAAVIGGVYPFHYALSTKPEGMSIDAKTGVIDWPNPPEGAAPHAVTLEVTDQAGTLVRVSWSISVTKSGFRFLDAQAGKTVAQGGTGTKENPWRALGDMYEGTTHDAKGASTYRYEFLYFRSGTYAANDAFLEDLAPDGTGRVPLSSEVKPAVWLAYPGDEAPTLDLSRGYLVFYGGNDNIYFDGFRITPLTNYARKGIGFDPGNDVTIRRCSFSHLTPGGIGGSNNQSAIMIGNSQGAFGNFYAFSDNTFDDLVGYSIIAYTSNKVLFENNSISNIDGSPPAIGPKANNSMWFIRGNRIEKVTDARVIWLYNGNGDGQETANQEVSYNLVLTPENVSNALDVNGANPSSAGAAYVFRNTIVGKVQFSWVTSSTGPFHLYDNVIVNTQGTAGFTCVNCTAAGAQILAHDNLVGAPADGLVDAAGALTSKYSASCGTRGAQLSCP